MGGSFAGETPRPCAHPGCPHEGEYRAPTARPGSSFAAGSGPPQWQYFCLEHVRAFNASWNWFAGMAEEEIRRAETPHATWERETRAFAHNAFARGPDRVEDALGVLRWRAGGSGRVRRSATGQPLSRADLEALAVLGLSDSATLEAVKRRYRALVRCYHPDRHGGDRRHEARLQRATEAHDHLRRSPAFRSAT
jgi:hypothetical protein